MTIDLPATPQPLVISAPGASTGKPYVVGVAVNGVWITKPIIEHDVIKNGGMVEFEMSASPTAWASETVVGDGRVDMTFACCAG